jgi:two-component sensor histidine kinase
MTAISFDRIDLQDANIAFILENNPDIIIADYDPYYSEWQFELKNDKSTSDIAIICMIEKKSDFLPKYVDFTLNKPFNSQILVQILKVYSNKNNQMKELEKLTEIFQFDVIKINDDDKIIQARLTDNIPFFSTKDGFLDKHISEVFPQQLLDSIQEYLVKVRNSGKVISFHYIPTGILPEIWNQVYLIPLTKRTILILIKDITSIKNNANIHKTQFEISKAVLSSDDLSTLYKKIHEALDKIIPAESFYIAIKDSKTGKITAPYFYDKYEDIKLPVELKPNGISNFIIQSKKPLYVDNEVRDYLISTGKVTDYNSRSKSMLAVPLMVEDLAIGMIGIRSKGKEAVYNHSHLELLEFISGQITTAIVQKKNEKEILRAYQDKNELLQELYHRTKNNMQIIISMLSIQAKTSDNPIIKEHFKNISNRISAMSLTQEKLYKSKSLSDLNFKEYINDLILLLSRNNHKTGYVVKRELNIPDIEVNIDIILPLGLAINELVSNSYKHAFSTKKLGIISINAEKISASEIAIEYSDNGDGLAADFDMDKDFKMGLNNFRSIIVHQLKGSAEYKNNNGLTWKIVIKDNLYTRRI